MDALSGVFPHSTKRQCMKRKKICQLHGKPAGRRARDQLIALKRSEAKKVTGANIFSIDIFSMAKG
jgi:hypothetical protein